MGRNGFTLIELSIVLVIIGLIVGGILVGQDLIKAAEIRAQVSQVEKYQTSVNTFRTKYGYIPGDMTSTRATQLGFFSMAGASANTAGMGDGNGVIQSGACIANSCGEPVIFWRHLTDAQMIDGNYGTTASGSPINVNFGYAGSLAAGAVRQLLPPAKIGRGNYFVMLSIISSNYFTISGVTNINAIGVAMRSDAITPIEAQEIDIKMDDGLPLGGKVGGDSTGGSDCVDGLPPSTVYMLAPAFANIPACMMWFRMN